MGSFFENRMERTRKPRVIDEFLGNIDGRPADKMSQSEVEEFHRQSLKQIITLAYEKCPFYRKKMVEAGFHPREFTELNDIEKVPLLSKDELKGHPWALLACDKKDISVITVSTGTTGGEEIYIPTTWRDYILNDMTPRYPSLFPVDPGDICADLLPYEMSSSGLAFHKCFMDACLATSFNGGKGGAYSTSEKTVKTIKDLQPDIIITTPSWAVTLYEEAKKDGFDLSTLPLKKMWLTGEGCSDSFRRKLQNIYGTTANMYYGSLECGGIGIECDKHDGYHILNGHVFVEIIDPVTEEPVEPGEIGEIVVSCVLRYDTPIIRYRTKDLGYIDSSPCSCGVTSPRLVLRGRSVDHLHLNGREYSPYYLEEFLMRVPEVGNWYQFIVKKGQQNYLKIRTELAEGVRPSRRLKDKISSKLDYAIGLSCEVEFTEKIERTNKKNVRVIVEE